ncbi:MAG: cell division protein FtsL [Bradymonadales bacterium]|jgi:cell division protein FtsL
MKNIERYDDLHIDDALDDVLSEEHSPIVAERSMSFTSALMNIAGTRKRSGRLWMAVFATLVIVALLLAQVYYKHQVLNHGYALSSAVSEREALLEEQRKLRIELRILSSRERLEPLAKQNMGMAVLKPEQIIYRYGESSSEPVQPHVGRSDGLDKIRKIMQEPARGEQL